MIDVSSDLIAIVPARGNSQGILGKNLAKLSGKPLILWTLEAIDAAHTPIRTITTTDSDEIATLAQSGGSEIVCRPTYLAGHKSSSESALIHALAAIGAPDDTIVMMLQPTSPTRKAQSIDEAISIYLSTGCDSLVSVVQESPFLWRGPKSDAKSLYDHSKRQRRQDLDQKDRLYRENGSIYICRAGGLRLSNNRLHGVISLFEMGLDEGIDIDTPADLDFAHAWLDFESRHKTV